jgi:hypothetical protein
MAETSPAMKMERLRRTLKRATNRDRYKSQNSTIFQKTELNRCLSWQSVA